MLTTTKFTLLPLISEFVLMNRFVSFMEENLHGGIQFWLEPIFSM